MKTRYNKTMAIDIDGVLADFEEEFCQKFGSDNRRLFSLSARYPTLDKGLIDEFVSNEQTYEHLVPLFGGILLANQASLFGYYVLLMTARPRSVAQITKEWLEGFNVNYNEIWFSSDKKIAVQEYNRMYPRRPIQVVVDDNPETVTRVGGILGVKSFAWEQPWNEDVYPRIRYNQEKMRLEQRGSATDWFELWTGVK